MSDKFSVFLNQILSDRKWTATRLAKEAGVSVTTISDVINLQAKPGLKLCKGIAKVTNLPLDEILLIAGIGGNTPPPTERETDNKRLLPLYEQMNEQNRAAFLRQANFLVEDQKVGERKNENTGVGT